nr:glycosyltransferase 61 family protein [uncultured Roseococcus sp.]
MNGGFLLDGLRRLRSRVGARRRVAPVAPEVRPALDPARVALITPLMDAGYYSARGAALPGPASAKAAAEHYLCLGAAVGRPPNPAFDDTFYRAQLATPLPTGMTPLEHYLEHGAEAGLDPSPIFSTSDYLRVHFDVADAKVNPLWHFLRWGAGEGRLPLPDDVPDREERIMFVLARDPENVPALRMLGEIRLRHQRPDDALDALERAECGGPLDVAGRILKGEALLRLGAIDRAVPILTQALTEAPTLRAALPVDLLYGAGQRDLAMAILKAARPPHHGWEVTEAHVSNVRSTCLDEGFLYQQILPERPIEPIALRFAAEMPLPTARSGQLKAPAVYFAVLEDCVAIPRCTLLLHRDRMIYDLAAHELARLAVLGDHFGKRLLVRGRSGDQVLLERPTSAPLEHDEGLMMFGCQTHNYGHWCLEFLPRMLVFDRPGSGGAWPIIVDSGMPPTHLEALALLNTRGRPVIQIPDDRALRFERLGVAPVPTFFPCDSVPGIFYDAVWPADVLGDLNQRILQALGLSTEARPAATGRRIFISRKGFSQRRLINEAEIAALLARRGFETVSPEEHSFEEQVRLFHSASVIVGSCSSGLTSALFCRPGTRVVGLIHAQPEFNYRGYASFLRAAGAEIEFVRGTTSFEPREHPYHRSYRIDPSQIAAPLEWAERRA